MLTERLAGLTVHLSEQPGRGATCVLLHGFGAPGTDLVGLHRAIAAPAGTCFVFPEALLELDGMPGARAWWIIDMLEYQTAVVGNRWEQIARVVPEGLRQARERIVQLLGELETRYGVDRSRLVLGGFSQGAMLACDVALQASEPLSGLAILSGGLVAEEVWKAQAPLQAGLRVYQAHGVQDPVIPFQGGEMLSRLLSDAGLDVTFEPFEGGHGVPPVALAGIGRLLEKT